MTIFKAASASLYSPYSVICFNPDGSLKDEIKFEEPFKLFSISNEGIVLASKSDEEITKLYIFQLKL